MVSIATPISNRQIKTIAIEELNEQNHSCFFSDTALEISEFRIWYRQNMNS